MAKTIKTHAANVDPVGLAATVTKRAKSLQTAINKACAAGIFVEPVVGSGQYAPVTDDVQAPVVGFNMTFDLGGTKEPEPEVAEGADSYTMSTAHGDGVHAVRVAFPDHPGDTVIRMLKGYDFRWNASQKFWHRRAGPKALDALSDLSKYFNG